MAAIEEINASMRPPPKEAEYADEAGGWYAGEYASMRPPPKEAEYIS